MRNIRIRKPSPAMVVACLALFMAMGGVGYAAVVLPKNSVGTKQLKPSAVQTSDIAASAVNGAKVADASITGADVDEATLGEVPSATSAANAATLDGIDSAGFYASGSKVADSAHADAADNATNAGNAGTLDGKDSTAFGTSTVQAAAFMDFCDTAATWNECGVVVVTVPAGKTYKVSIWNSATVAGNGTAQNVTFCAARKLATGTAPSCVTPSGVSSKYTVPASGFGAFSSSGETTVDGGTAGQTWQFSLGFNPTAQVGFDDFGQVVTKVLIRNADAPAPTAAAKAVTSARR